MFKNFSECFTFGLSTRNEIQVFSDIFSDDFLEKCHHIVNTTQKIPSRVGNDRQSKPNFKIRDALNVVDDNNAVYSDIKEQIKQAMYDKLCDYVRSTNYIKFVTPENFAADTCFNFIVYEPNSRGYKEHVDAFYQDTSMHKRLFSCVYYLNDDFIGGDLYFPRLNKKIKVQKNSIVIFPSSPLFSHVGLKLSKGRKVICPAWFGYQIDKPINFQPII